MARPRPSPFLLALLSVVALLAAVSVAANGEGKEFFWIGESGKRKKREEQEKKARERESEAR